jgi:membrane dipeptidase
MQIRNGMVTEDYLNEARGFLDSVPLIDGHNDLAWILYSRAGGDFSCWDPGLVHAEHDTDLIRLREGRVAMQVLTAFVPTAIDHPARTVLELIDILRRMEQAYPHLLYPVRDPSGCDVAFRSGRTGSFLAVEGGIGLEGSLARLRLWQALGVRLMTLCHNETLDWVDSATDAPRHHGLSTFGREVIVELNRLGMIIDLSHTAPSVMHQVLDISRAPVVWSHSNALALCDHPRNVPDDILDRVSGTGGLVMATFVPDFISQASRDWHRPLLDSWGKVPFERWASRAQEEIELVSRQGPCPQATLSEYCDHVEYLARRCGIDHVGIGSDYFGGPSTRGLEHVGCFPHIFAELLHRGWDHKSLEKLAGSNFIRVWATVLQKA